MSENGKETTEWHLKLDDISLSKVAGGYPQELRDPLMWLGWLLREEFGRDLDAMTMWARELGAEHDKTTWSKVLRGRWNTDASNEPLRSPVVALPKLLRSIELLKEGQRVRELSGQVPFIMTPTAQSIFDYIDIRRSPGRVNRFGVIVGHTGSQKTASFKEYQRQHNHGLCSWLEAPDNGSRREFVISLSAKYGGSEQDSMERGQRRILKTVNHTRTIIVDNAQALYRPEGGTNQPVFNFLRRLQDEKQCTVILSVTPEFSTKLQDKMLLGYFEQFEGRCGGRRNFLMLPNYPSAEDVLAIAKGFGLKDAEKHQAYLEAIAHEPGRVRILFEVLQSAKIRAEGEQKPLTIGLVKEARGED